MSDQCWSLVVSISAALFVIVFLGRIISQIIGVSQESKHAGGLRGMVAKWRATRPLSRTYPLVSPVWETKKLLWGGSCMALLGLLLIGAGWFAQQAHIRQIRLLESETVTTMARIMNKTISRHEDGDRWYYIHYAFTAVVDDRQVELDHITIVPQVFYDRFERGDDLLVAYARSEPRIVNIKELYTPDEVDYRRLTILGGAGLFCCFFAWSILGNYGNACRLDNEGVQATTRVLEYYMVRSSRRSSPSSSYYVAYELPGFGPVRHSVGAARYFQLTVGDLVRLTYLPDRPEVFRVEWE